MTSDEGNSLEHILDVCISVSVKKSNAQSHVAMRSCFSDRANEQISLRDLSKMPLTSMTKVIPFYLSDGRNVACAKGCSRRRESQK